MAAQSHTTSRRALLGSLAAAPVFALAISAPATAAPQINAKPWLQALADYRQKEAAMNAYDRDYLIPISNEHAAFRGRYPTHYDFQADERARAVLDEIGTRYDPIQQRFDDLVDAHSDALLRLLATPAPNADALAIKLRAVQDYAPYERSYETAREVFSALTADAVRLSQGRA